MVLPIQMDPLLNILESGRFFIGRGVTVQIEAKEDAIRVPKVGRDQTHVFLLTGTVPQLQSAVDALMFDRLPQEVDADGRLHC
jgi:hypothetical protein